VEGLIKAVKNIKNV